jgi:hypothetical protein
MYIGAFMEAIPMAIPPISLKNTIREMDSGKKEGRPEPQADMLKRIAAQMSDFFRPMALLIIPALAAPTRAPNKALLTIKPFNHPVSSKYLEK